jgi:hypothetical protein
MNFMTPNEAVLKAENDRLRAENEYLKSAVDRPGVHFGPVAAVEDLRDLNVDYQEIRLPLVAGVQANLANDGRWHVMASSFGGADKIAVKYFADERIFRQNTHYAVNEILPKLHDKFIRMLAEEIKRY